MKHPTKEAVLRVASIFKELSKNKENIVRCSEESIRKSNCDTVACHAGWYMYNTYRHTGYWSYFDDREGVYKPAKIGVMVITKPKIVRALYFQEGADFMAKDLGFSSRFDLQQWARENPYIWGNRYGGWMFSFDGECAFLNQDEPTELTLSVIADHWESVAGRLP